MADDLVGGWRFGFGRATREQLVADFAIPVELRVEAGGDQIGIGDARVGVSLDQDGALFGVELIGGDA